MYIYKARLYSRSIISFQCSYYISNLIYFNYIFHPVLIYHHKQSSFGKSYSMQATAHDAIHNVQCIQKWHENEHRRSRTDIKVEDRVLLQRKKMNQIKLASIADILLKMLKLTTNNIKLNLDNLTEWNKFIHFESISSPTSIQLLLRRM